MSYLRFVVGSDQENPHRCDGIFTESRMLRDGDHLFAYEVEILEAVYRWYNANVPVPPFRTSRWPVDAVSWFRDDAAEPIGRMWEIVCIMRDHGSPVRVIRTSSPGKIVYSDSFQVVAVGYVRSLL